jgi:hypothetical protein
MMTLEHAAHRVADQGDGQREVFIDPITIMLICSVLSTLFAALRLWCQARQGQQADGEQIKEVCANPPFRVRRRLARHIRTQIGPKKYRQYGQELETAIFRAGADASSAEIEYLANQYDSTEQEL